MLFNQIYAYDEILLKYTQILIYIIKLDILLRITNVIFL